MKIKREEAMVKQFMIVVVALFCLSQTVVSADQSNEMSVPWSELGPLITGKKVSLVLPGAVHVQGEVIAVRADSLVLNVSKTADKQAYPKGRTEIPRSSVSVVERKRMPRNAGRIIGTVVGFVGGGIAGFFLADRYAVGRKAHVSYGTLAGTTALGYYLGHITDREVIYIKVIPE